MREADRNQHATAVSLQSLHPSLGDSMGRLSLNTSTVFLDGVWKFSGDSIPEDVLEQARQWAAEGRSVRLEVKANFWLNDPGERRYWPADEPRPSALDAGERPGERRDLQGTPPAEGRRLRRRFPRASADHGFREWVPEKITVMIDRALHGEISRYARRNGLRLGWVLHQALSQWRDQHRETTA
jgi:hypothetical protein